MTRRTSSTISKIWQELAEVSASLSCARDKLASKLDEVVANVEETARTRRCFEDRMFDTRTEVNRSEDKITEVQMLVHGLQMHTTEIIDLATTSKNTTKFKVADDTC
jgi:hypothetical protein